MRLFEILRHRYIARPVAALLVTVLVWSPSHVAWADAFTDGAKLGDQTGKTIVPKDVGTVDSAGNITLLPKSEKPVHIPATELFPGATGDYSDFTSVYGDDQAMIKKGQEAQKALEIDPSRTGEAYRVLRESAGLSRPGMREDPLWKSTDETLGKLDLIADGFGDCSKETQYQTGTKKAHIADYKTCERVFDPSANCKIRHDYTASVLRHVAGPLNIRSCGVGCMEVWIGEIGDNYYSGRCSIFETSMTMEIVNPNAITSAVLNYAKWDDYMQVWIGGTKVWSGPDGNFPPETPGRCELSTSWERNPNVDVTPYFRQAGQLTFKTRVSVTGGGEGYGRIQINYEPSKAVTEDAWSPADCIQSARGIVDGFCRGGYSCSRMPPVAGDCTEVNGVQICRSQLQAPPISQVDKLCQEVSVNSSCGFYTGSLSCYTDVNGQRQCPTNNGGNLHSCAALEANPRCGFISSKCVGGAQASSGTCYVKEETWDCGYDTDIPTTSSSTSYNCAGPIRCMGTECTDPNAEASGDFVQAASALQVAQFVGHDSECTGQDGTANVTCTTFMGKPYECKKAVGGIVDCCESPGGVSLAQYMDLLFAMNKLDNAVMAMDSNSMVRGAWEVLREPVADSWTAVSDWFSSAWNSISGSTAAVSDTALDTVVSSFRQDLLNETAQWVAETFGQGTADLFFNTGASGAVELGGTAGTAMSWIMTAYMYYSLFILAVNLIWKCEQKEFELGAQRELKLCTHVGSYCASKVLGSCVEKRESYCCFSSPLSRIVQEQVKPQLGMNFGSPESPQCGGIPMDRLKDVDWSKVNLDEWIGILSATAKLPDAASINIDGLTGSENYLDIYDSRDDAAERANKRVEDLDTTGIRLQTSDELRGR